MTRAYYVSLFSLFAILLLSAGELSGQSVNCPQCSSGICEGESLADYIAFSGYTQPIEIIGITGAVSGAGNNLLNYQFSVPGSSISINFNDGDGNLYTETVSVSVLDLNPIINVGNTFGCASISFNASGSSAPSGIIAYNWNISAIDGSLFQPIANFTSSSFSYDFGVGGIYQVCLSIEANNGCISETCELVEVGNTIPGLIFQEGPNPTAINNADEFLVAYCNSGASFNLLGTDASSLSGAISSYVIEVDGVTVYSNSAPPIGAQAITTQTGGFNGYNEVTLTITTSDGCVSTVAYQVYFGSGNNPTFAGILQTTTNICPDDLIEIQTDLSASNPVGSDYTLDVMCGDASIASWQWIQSTPEPLINWTPEEPSCNCPDSEYIILTTAIHPCMTGPNISTSNLRVHLPLDAEFERVPTGNLCLNDLAEFTWLNPESVIDTLSWCSGDVNWTITDESNNAVFINGIFSDPLMTHTFNQSGTFEVCQEVINACTDDLYCEFVCVNPDINNVDLFPNWNIPPVLCPGDEFTSELTYSNLDFCAPPEITWELYFEGGLIETFTGLTADIVDLQKGEYELVVTFELEDCGEIDESTLFEVVAPPIITPELTGPFSSACEGDLICFDEWFCIDDCGDALIDFELILYEGFLSDCDATPSGALAEVITDQLPSPPYADCDPTAACSYQWIAEPGQYTLWIKAENNCGPDFECITIDIPFPNIPVITGDEEVCVNAEVELNASLVGGTFTFDSCPLGCPTPGNGPGQYTTSGSTLNWDTQEGLTPPGDYIISYGGDCIGTGQITVTVQPLPEFSIQSSIPSTVCEGDLVDLDIDYLGPNALDGCNWINVNTGLSISNPDCQVSVDPASGSNQYSVTVTDENGCEASESIDIEELTQPFTTDCSALQGSYCNNEGAVIDLTTLLTPYPATGVLSWTLNGVSITGATVDLNGLSDGTYTLGWEWLHPTAPNCLFEGECTFDIAPPITPSLTGNDEYCQGETVTVNVSGSNGLQGTWDLISCPGICPTAAVFSPFSFSWITDENDDAGTYTIEYSGACLEPVTFSFTLNALPEFTIATDPGDVICNDQVLTLDIDYTGSSSIQECFWVNENNGTSISPTDCEIEVQPTDVLTNYSVTVVDANGCENSADIDISIQTQPFTFDCSSIEPVYCDNETATIDLSDLVSINPVSAQFEWFLNGNVLSGTTVDVEALSAANSPFSLSYIYTSSQSPNCVFEGECTFAITDLTTPIISNNSPVCAGGELSATVTGNNGLIGTWTFVSCPNNDCPTDFTTTATTLTWQTSSDTEPGDYEVSYSGDCLEPVSFSFTVNALPEFTIATDPGDVICNDQVLTLDIDYTGSSSIQECFWVNENNGTSISPPDCEIEVQPADVLTNYSVIVEDANGCENSADIDISIQTQPFTFDCSSIEPVYCDNETATIALSDLVSINPVSAQFEWFLNGNVLSGTTVDVEALSAANSPFTLSYIYTSSQSPNCVFEGECTFAITDLTTPSISNNSPVCAGGELSATVTGNNGLIGTWTFVSCPNNDCPTDFTTTATTLTWQTSSDTEPGDYEVSYSGDCLEPVSFSFTVNALPEFTIATDPGDVICNDQVLTLDIDYTGSSSIQECFWVNENNGSSISPTDCEIEVQPTDVLTNYSVIVEDANGCENSADIDISIQTQPFTFDCSSIEPVYCDNETATIDLSDLVSINPVSAQFEWFLNGNVFSGTTVDVEALSAANSPFSLSYIYTSSQSPNCVFEGECTFAITDLTTPIISNNSPVCAGGELSATVTGNNGLIGTWTFVSCPNNDCPTDFTTTGTTLTWQTSSDTEPGDYEVSYSGDCLEDVITVLTVNELPDILIDAVPGELICEGDLVNLNLIYTGSGNVACTWENLTTGTSLADINCSVSTSLSSGAESIAVFVIDDNGCAASDTIDISIQTQPFTFDCSSIEPVYCDNETATIDLSDLVSINPVSAQFEWFLNGNVFSGTTVDVEALSAANSPFSLSYIYTSSQSPNCVFEGECTFAITDLTTPIISNNSPVCAGGELSATVTGNNGLIGTWTFVSCPNNDCPTDFTTTGTTLTWQTSSDTEPGDYEVSYSGDCLEDVITVLTVNELPDISIDAVPGELICEGDLVNLNLIYTGSGNVACTWENLTTGTSLADINCSVSTSLSSGAESIAVFVIDDNGCTASDTIDISIQTQPFEFSCPDITSFCDNEAVVIDFEDLVDIDPSSVGFTWFLDGNTIPDSFLDLEPLDPAGSPYELSYIYDHPDAPNCSFSGSCILTISALTPPLIVSDGPICLGEEISVNISQNSGFIGSWSFIDCPGSCPLDFTTNDLTLNWLTSISDTPGVYTVQYEGNCLETVTESFTVHALPDFVILSAPDAIVCNGDSIALSINNLGVTDIPSCEWSDAQGLVAGPNCEIGVLPDGASQIYYIEVTDLNGCQANDSIELNIQQQPFSFDCSPISETYCDNEVITIDLEDLIGIDPTVDFSWFLNGTIITGQFLDIEALPPATLPYVLTYEYLHPLAPNCLFSDSCSFFVTDLTLPEISGNDEACINDSIILISSNTNGFQGSWTFMDCPSGDCPSNIQTNADSLIWITDDFINTPGIYEIQYTGTCLDTALYVVTVHPLPSFNVISFPGETVCAEDTIVIEIEYTGTASITSCLLSDGFGTEITGDGLCQYTLLPENLQGPYTLEVTDSNGCINNAPFQIDIQEQPFEFDCLLETTYCDNSTDVINLDAQISPFPVNGSLNWFINGAPLATSTLNVVNLPPDDYSLTYVYEHGDSPFCAFSDSCAFQVTQLVRPELSGQIAYCQGEQVELFADSLGGFSGEWTNVSCPQPPCLPAGTNPTTFVWSSAGAALGEYVFQYAGLCLQTVTYTIQILGNPTVEWTPLDATPCLNECFPFFAEIIENEDAFGWEVQTIFDTIQLTGNEVCFDDIGNPELIDICLWAESYYPVEDTSFTCYVSDCETITPVFSPENAPELPTQACPGEVLEIEVDYSFYDDCAFLLNGFNYDDCEAIFIPDGPYGTFPYEIQLGYQGCTDTLQGEIFIPQPPSGDLLLEYDPCVADVFGQILNLQGDALNFDWSVEDNPGFSYDFLMTSDTEVSPVPNPIPLSNLDLTTDTTFYVSVEISNFCESLVLEDTVNFIAVPSIETDIANTSGTLFCLPQEFSFEIAEFSTAYIDSVNWVFESIYNYGNLTDTTYNNLQFPPTLVFENNGQTDTVNIYITAYNQCGLDQDTISFILIPPNVYLEMPDYAAGVCPANQVTIPTEIVEGNPFNGCEVTTSPLIPGLTYSCEEDLSAITLNIPESTPAGIYSIITTISGCGSSTDFTDIEIFPVPDIEFDFDDQVCTNTEISFSNQTEGAASFEWNFGDPFSLNNISFLSFPIFVYDAPGIYDVSLTATSDSGCVSIESQAIEIFGPNPTLSIDSTAICSGGTANIEFEAQDDILSLLWEFILPGEDTLIYTVEQGVENTFYNDSNNIDIWNINLILEDIYGCIAQADTQLIVFPQPTAFFTHSQLDGCAQGAEVYFNNQSTANTSSKWFFDDPESGQANISFQTNPAHSFSRPGDYFVTLYTQNSFGCRAQFIRRLGCNKVEIYVPNAFTPDGNGLNEVFKPSIFGMESIGFTEPNYYTFQIFDRWGLKIFETHDYEEGWKGTSGNDEYYARPDVYIWRVELKFPEGVEKRTGHVTLVR